MRNFEGEADWALNMEDSPKAEDSIKEIDIASPRETKDSSSSFTNQDGVLRENMVDLATRFLTNSRVQSSPMEQRRAFLKKKG